MQKASFSIDKYTFSKVSIDLENHVSQDILLSFDTSGVFIAETTQYELRFSVTAFNDEKTVENPFIFVQCNGSFSFQDVASFEEIPDYFYRNSIAILFPYLRAYVSVVTSQANVPGIILPILNLSSLEDDLRKNSSQK